MTLFLAGLLTFLAGGVLAAALSRWPRAASFAGMASAVVGAALGATMAVDALRGEAIPRFEMAWRIPAGAVVLGCDPLSGFFLLPIFVLGAVSAVYGRDYLLAFSARKSLAVPWLAFNWLLASLAVVVTARHALVLLVAWEMMSLCAYVLVTFEHEHAEVRRAGWVYLVFAHIGIAFLIGAFVFFGASTGTLLLDASTLTTVQRNVFLVLALAGFGLKAGLFPAHPWLPEAHAAAPSHVSAVMSGVLVKMGIYGILRMVVMVGGPPLWLGRLLLVMGVVTAIYGITVATYQRDLKRVFAYSTIENIGIVTLGLGLGFWGRATGHPTIAALGTLGALLHVWNHTAMKGLLFLGAGAVLHATGTKDLERLGGLLRRMPIAGSLVVFGAVAIAGLPPLNGFVGEWLLYRSLIHGSTVAGPGASAAFTFALGALAAVGGLASLAFLRACSTALLGEPRSAEAAAAHDASPSMLGAMSVLACACLFFSVGPFLVVGLVERVAAPIAGVDHGAIDAVRVSLVPMGVANLVLLIVTAASVSLVVRASGGREHAAGPTWDCGYVAPTSRMQYTARGFAQLVGELIPRWFRPRIEVRRPDGLFPTAASLASNGDDPIMRGSYEPVIERGGFWFTRLRWLQQGSVHLYVLYVLIAVVSGLAWLSLRSWELP